MSKDRAVADNSKRALMRNFVNASGLTLLASLLGPAASREFRALAAGQARPSPGGDAAVINAAIQLEQKAINTYKAALQADLLKDPDLADVAIEFVSDHSEHRDQLTRALRINFKAATPALIEKLGTFNVPETVLKGKDTDVLRYALTLETIAAKVYFDSINQKLATDEARGLAASILNVETQHVAVYRYVLMVVKKDKGLPEDKQLVPFAFFSDQPTPAAP